MFEQFTRHLETDNNITATSLKLSMQDALTELRHTARKKHPEYDVIVFRDQCVSVTGPEMTTHTIQLGAVYGHSDPAKCRVYGDSYYNNSAGAAALWEKGRSLCMPKMPPPQVSASQFRPIDIRPYTTYHFTPATYAFEYVDDNLEFIKNFWKLETIQRG